MSNKTGVEGRFRIQLQNEDGSDCFDSGEQKNIIVDGALNYKQFPPQASDFLCLGAGVVTDPAVTDTNLGNQVAAKSIRFNVHTGTLEVDHFSTKSTATVEFTNLDYTLTELGIKTGGSSGVLITRALIKDAQDNPSPLVVLPSQTLKLTYSLYYKFPLKLSEGIMATPHGDLHWELALWWQTAPHATGVASDAKHEWGFYECSGAKIGGVSATGSASPDVPTKTSTLTGTLPAQAADKVLNAGDMILTPNVHARSSYVVILKAPYTIPKNHIFTISAEVYWGRLT